jgi:class 3 adenylate cyclase/tetratricopeptide (TPR) repeat protein
VIACSTCGQENPAGARFCNACGAELAAERTTAREVRKTVTVLFCDLAGYTSRGEQLDPEALRRVQSQYFEDARAALERHGASVEKFIGDAVMAVFGIPQLHEDDALRALRAAVELRDAVSDLGLQARIGVNTGEVVSGSGDALVTGDAVNVAARLEQAAQPGEILLGEQTLRLARDAVEVAAVDAVAAKGKSEPVPAYRLVGVVEGAPAFARRLDSPMVGRDEELAQLRQALARTVRERRCHLFTVLGPAGIGKSRLVAELATSAREALVLSGPCLPYGEGITYWPLIDIFRSASAEAQLDDAMAAPTSEETFLAVRRFLESLARERPLVVVFEDIHWAEPTLLDLIDHVADWSRDAPILVACLARPELLDARPAWGGGKVNASTILLEPLPEEDCDILVKSLLGTRTLAEDVRRRIVVTAEGNPLFVEQMVAMLGEDGANGEVPVPPTIQALIAARLDRLPTDEREVAERASVIGKEFDRAALAALAPEPLRPALATCLLGLVRKELIRPHAQEDAFRFANLLIRDAAYEAMSKELRSELHERFAAWLAELEAVPERDEILGYHLEQAYRYKTELGSLGDAGRELGRRAAERLAHAGRNAYARGDMPAAANLLGRAASLLGDDDPERLALLPDLGSALFEAGGLLRAREVLVEAVAGARHAHDAALGAHAGLRLALLDTHTDPETGTMERLYRESERAIPIFEQAEDHAGLAQAWRLTGLAHFWLGRTGMAIKALERAIEHARRAGAAREEADSLEWLPIMAIFGPMPAEDGRARCMQIIERGVGGMSVEAFALVGLGALTAMCGSMEAGRELVARGRVTARELGLRMSVGGTSLAAGTLELIGNDAAAAERILREGYDLLEEVGETGYLASVGAMLAEAVYRQGRYDEAQRYALATRDTVATDDLDPQVRWRGVAAKVLAQRGELERAKSLAREAVDLVESTDWLHLRAELHRDLAEVLLLSGAVDAAAHSLEHALALYEEKGDLPDAERVRERLAELRAQPPTTS